MQANALRQSQLWQIRELSGSIRIAFFIASHYLSRRMYPRLSAPFAFILLATLPFAWAQAPVAAWAQPLPAASANSPASGGAVILLRNGQVLRGALQLSEGSYLVELGGGGTVQLPRENVDMICGSLVEAYQLQANRINPGNTAARLSLASWCLREGMFPQAEQQLRILETLSPQDRRIASLKRRVEIERRAALAARLEAIQLETTGAPAIHEEPPTTTEAVSHSQQDLLQATARLDQLPEGTLETFTRVVQPILLNGCSATACHGSHSGSEFRLTGFDSGVRFTQSSTQENFSRVLAYLDQANASASPLLSKPGTPGVCTPEGVWSSAYDARPRQIQDWIEQCYPPASVAAGTRDGSPLGAALGVTGTREPLSNAEGSSTVPASVPRLLAPRSIDSAEPLMPASGNPTPIQQAGAISGSPRSDVTPRHLPTPAAAFTARAEYEALIRGPEEPAPSGPTRGVRLETEADGVRDPFDVEIFHRRLLQPASQR